MENLHCKIFEDWNMKQYLGEGTTASVYLAQNKETSEEAVIKYFHGFEDNCRDREEACNKLMSNVAASEAEILSSLSHPRIIKLLDFYLPQSSADGSCCRPALVLERAPHGDLFDLNCNLGSLPSPIVKYYFLELLDALEYLHNDAGICHRDIKPENILLDESFNIKLTDFGHAKKMEAKAAKGRADSITENQLSSEIAGTPEYLSPEMHLGLPHDPHHSDMFALGITLFMMMSGIRPFDSATESDELYKLIIAGDFESFWEAHEELRAENFGMSVSGGFYRKEFRELMNRMFAYDVKSRFSSIEELRESAWCKQGVLIRNETVKGLMEQFALKKQIKF